ncbi:TetR/AcrR family transcriptional regulator [Paenibacillus sp. N1-5-1-14]|uniref:TetR/AcrR family transcriptional regulator n=1 Tax=Paenibacillus radicibacter TaxID=2972488 RepID=UPI002158D796|nr:TetR/AcrR family transcriptional regulator [Paenibacillus radicibacter]MCR8641183.1 TetR/AcrR family transcriptional regulator [Paenibacillus radicibacter]
MFSRRERRDAAEHRRIILQKAKELFITYGVNEVSMHKIAKEAGVGQGTLYRRYANKADLCLDVVLESYVQVNERMNTYLIDNEQEQIDVRIAQVISDWVDYAEETYQWLGGIKNFQFAEGACFSDSPIYKTMHERISQLLEEQAQEKGLAARDHTFITDMIIYATGPSMYQLFRVERNYSVEALKNNLMQMTLT